jgi:hypothetical protein
MTLGHPRTTQLSPLARTPAPPQWGRAAHFFFFLPLPPAFASGTSGVCASLGGGASASCSRVRAVQAHDTQLCAGVIEIRTHAHTLLAAYAHLVECERQPDVGYARPSPVHHTAHDEQQGGSAERPSSSPPPPPVFVDGPPTARPRPPRSTDKHSLSRDRERCSMRHRPTPMHWLLLLLLLLAVWPRCPSHCTHLPGGGGATKRTASTACAWCSPRP